MLYKLSLKFKDPSLEIQYQRDKSLFVVKPVFTLINYCILLGSAMSLLHHILSFDQKILIGSTVVLIMAIIQQLVINYYPKFIPIGIFISFHMVLLTQLNIDKDSSSIYSYFLGSNSSIVCLIMLYICDCPMGFLCNCSLLGFRIGYSTQQMIDKNYEQYALCIIIFVVLTMCLRLQNSTARLQYFMTLKDNQWEKVLPSMMSNEFILYQYNEEWTKFDTKMTNMKEIDNNQINILRQLQYQGNTLENYIFNRIKNKEIQNVQHQELKVNHGKKYITIKYSEFYLVNYNFIIVLPLADNIQLQTKYQEMYNNKIANLTKLIGIVQQSISRSVQQNNIRKLSRISTLLLSYKLQQTIKLDTIIKVERLDLVEILRKFQRMARVGYKIEAQSHIIINTIREYWYILLTQILLYSPNSRITQIHVVNDNKLVIETHLNFESLQINNLFQRMCQVLLARYRRISTGLILYLEDEPNISFAEYPPT